jgi:hypothetical protein
MPKKTVKRSSKSKASTEKKDAKAFIDHLETNRVLRTKLRKGWDAVLKDGKKKGYKFTREELRSQFAKRYGVGKLMRDDEPDTCICII